MKTKRARQHIAPYSVTPRRALKEVGSHEGKVVRNAGPARPSLAECYSGQPVSIACESAQLFYSQSLYVNDSIQGFGCASDGSVAPVDHLQGFCALLESLPDVEGNCTIIAQECQEWNDYHYPKSSSSINPSPTIAATGATVGLLSTLASLVTPTPTAVIAAAAPQTTLTYLAIGLGSAGALGTVGLAGYGAYKLGSWLCEDNNQIHPQESA